MILHASTKMDASNYIDWIIGRLGEGYFLRDFNDKIVNKVLLNNIEKLYLYTRTPSKIYRNRDLFKSYNTRLTTFVTLYDKLFEPKIKDKEKIIRCIKKCKGQFDENYFGYGPIFYTESHNKEWHLAQFDFLCHELAAHVDGVCVSFRINESCQTAKNMTCRPLDFMEQTILLGELEEIAKKHRLEVELMRYEDEFADDEIDIGENNCCPYACGYCPYITNSGSAIAKYKMLNSSSPMLYGIVANSQKIKVLDIDADKKKGNENMFVQTSIFDMLQT